MFTCILNRTLLHCITTFRYVLLLFHLGNNVNPILFQFRGKYDIISTQRARQLRFLGLPDTDGCSIVRHWACNIPKIQKKTQPVVSLESKVFLILIFSGVVSSWLHHNSSRLDYMWLIYLSQTPWIIPRATQKVTTWVVFVHEKPFSTQTPSRCIVKHD